MSSRQVFGLAGDLVARLPGLQIQASAVWAFVPAYRCGAAPESHRIPVFIPMQGMGNQRSKTTLRCVFRKCNHNMRWIVWKSRKLKRAKPIGLALFKSLSKN